MLGLTAATALAVGGAATVSMSSIAGAGWSLSATRGRSAEPRLDCLPFPNVLVLLPLLLRSTLGRGSCDGGEDVSSKGAVSDVFSRAGEGGVSTSTPASATTKGAFRPVDLSCRGM